MSKNIFDLLPDVTINESELAFIAGGKKKDEKDKKEEEEKKKEVEMICYIAVCFDQVIVCSTGIAG